jgi:hypothetical protein
MTTERDRSPLPRWLASLPPPAAVEVARDRVTAVSLAGHGGAAVLAGYATARLPAGALDPVLNAANVHDAAALAGAIAETLDGLSPRPRRIGLVVPDTVAKVSLVRFEKVPPRAQDLDQLIRWQVRKAAPFRVEDAQIAWVPAHRFEDGSREFLVTMARRDIVESYEKACAAAGAYAGIVDLATFNLANLAMAGREARDRRAGPATGGDPSTLREPQGRLEPGRGATRSGSTGAASRGDWLLVHAAPDYATLVIVRAGEIIFFRNRTTEDGADLVDLAHQTAMYHEDRLGGGGFSRILLAGAAVHGVAEAERLRRLLEERTGTRAEPAGFGSAVTLRDRITASPELMDTLAPAVGLLLRERPAGRGAPERVA